jgi:hypothetical protein
MIVPRKMGLGILRVHSPPPDIDPQKNRKNKYRCTLLHSRLLILPSAGHSGLGRIPCGIHLIVLFRVSLEPSIRPLGLEATVSEPKAGRCFLIWPNIH